MLFGAWMDANKITAGDVVEKVKQEGLETTIDMVYKVRADRRRFSPEITDVIVKWAEGQVSWEEMNFPERFKKASSE